MKIIFSRKEVGEILISTGVLSLAFALAREDGIFNLQLGILPLLILFSFIAVGIGFLAHELIGHKLIAQRMDMHAEFKMWNMGLAIALISSLFGFVFAAPGAVYVSPKVDLWGQPAPVSRRKMGIVSIAGPIVNIILAFMFLFLGIILPVQVGGIQIFNLGVFINVWLALFNMLPIPPLDGSKVLAWDKRLWIGLFAVCAGFFIIQNLFLTGF